MTSTMLLCMTISLLSSLASADDPTMLQQSPAAHPFYYSYQTRHVFNPPISVPLLLSPATGPQFTTGPQSATNNSAELSKVLNLNDILDIVLFKKLTSRINQLEETVKNLTAAVSDLSSPIPTSIGGIPKSCDDLQKLGNSKSGLFNIKSGNQLGTVYCDFTKAVGAAGFQQWIGYDDVKTDLVYFYAQKSGSAATGTLDRIPFEIEKLNLGNALNGTSGTFTAPVNGMYYLAFTGAVVFTDASTLVRYFYVELRLNDNVIVRGEVDESNNGVQQFDSLHVSTTIKLKKGDEVWVTGVLYTGLLLFSNANTYFTGMLLAEEIFP